MKPGPKARHHRPTARRPSPPGYLTPEQAALFVRVANSEDAETFATAATADMLAEYCVRACLAQRLSAMIDATPPGEILGENGGDFDRLLRARERESRAVIALARTLRITNQARITPGAAGAGQGLPPDDADDPTNAYFN